MTTFPCSSNGGKRGRHGCLLGETREDANANVWTFEKRFEHRPTERRTERHNMQTVTKRRQHKDERAILKMASGKYELNGDLAIPGEVFSQKKPAKKTGSDSRTSDEGGSVNFSVNGRIIQRGPETFLFPKKEIARKRGILYTVIPGRNGESLLRRAEI